MEPTFQFIDRYGIPVVILVVLGVVFWKVGKFVGYELIIPIRNNLIGRIIAFFDHMDQSLDRMEANHGQHGGVLVRIEEKIEMVAETCDRIETGMLQRPPKAQHRLPTKPPGSQEQTSGSS
jgi:hypothetical protein